MPFIAFYDQVYRSLRLSGRLLDRDVATGVFRKVVDLGSQNGLLKLEEPLLRRASAIAEDLASGAEEDVLAGMGSDQLLFEATFPGLMPSGPGLPAEPGLAPPSGDRQVVRVLAPGSRGVDIARGNEDFVVDAVFFSPSGLCYRGRHPSDTDPTVTVIVPVANVIPTPGEPMALYDMQTGQVTPL